MSRLRWATLFGVGGLTVLGLVVSVTWAEPLQPPGTRFLLGTDALGRDYLPYLLRSVSLTIIWASLSMLFSMAIGGWIGLLLGLGRGRWVRLGERVLDVFLALPGLLLALAILALLDRGLFQVALAVGVALIPVVARVVRGMALSIKSAGYIEAALVSGGDLVWVMRFHAWPVLARQILRFAGVVFAWGVLNTAALDFLGFHDPGIGRTLGGLIDESRVTMRIAPLLTVIPSLLLTILISTFWFLFFDEGN